MNLIIGCGYLGMRVARLWLAEEVPVAAITRNHARAEEFRSIGLLPVEAEILKSETLSGLANLVGPTDTVLYAVGYDRASGSSMRDVYVQGLKNVLDSLPEQFGKFIYISSTGVYGQNDGSEVDENSLVEPTREGGKACLEAEQVLQAHVHGERAVILRLAGIYGQGRVPMSKDAIDKRKSEVNLDGFLNLIHVDDAARIVLLAERHAKTPKLYLVSDGNPVPRSEYYDELSRRFAANESLNEIESQNADKPTFASRGRTDKRIVNQKLIEDLAPKFLYPDFRTGLAAIRAGN